MQPIHLDHRFSCECEPFKQQWILRNYNPPFLFSDICTLGEEYAYCTKSDAQVEVPDCEVFAAGFSCRDVSGMNKNAAQYESCAESGAGTMGH